MEKKITKAEVLNAIKVAAQNGAEFEVGAEAVIEYVDKTLEQMANKVAKDKARVAEKRANDEILGKVEGALTDEFQTADAITAAIADEEVTKMKVVNRLTKLVADGKAVKDTVKVEGTKGTKTVYKLAQSNNQ